MDRDPARTPVVVDALRTPFGRYGGALASVRPDDLAAFVIRELVTRTGVDPASVDDVILGAANQAGEDNRNVGRMAVLLAGLPVSVAGQTINRLCGSGMSAVVAAAHAIVAGDGEVFIAGGTESMTRAPLVMAKPSAAFPRGEQTLYDTTLGWRFTNPRLAEAYYPYSMGETAENVVAQVGVSREDQDAFALTSQQRWAAAFEAGRFDDEVRPMPETGPRRASPPDHHHRATGLTEARLPARRVRIGHGGQQQRHQRWGRGPAGDFGSPRPLGRLEADDPDAGLGRGRSRPGHHGPRPDPGVASRARARRAIGR